MESLRGGRHLAVVGGIVTTGALLVGGCGSTTVDPKGAESLVRQSTAQGTHGTATSVNCPSNVKAKVGNTLECTFTLPDGTKGQATVHITSVNGSSVGLGIQPSDFRVTP